MWNGIEHVKMLCWNKRSSHEIIPVLIILNTEQHRAHAYNDYIFGLNYRMFSKITKQISSNFMVFDRVPARYSVWNDLIKILWFQEPVNFSVKTSVKEMTLRNENNFSSIELLLLHISRFYNENEIKSQATAFYHIWLDYKWGNAVWSQGGDEKSLNRTFRHWVLLPERQYSLCLTRSLMFLVLEHIRFFLNPVSWFFKIGLCLYSDQCTNQ